MAGVTTGQITPRCVALLSTPPLKNISLKASGKSLLDLRLSRLIRGAYRDRHERGARDAVDADCAARRTHKLSGRRSRVGPVPPILKFRRSSPRFKELQNRDRHWNQKLQLPLAFRSS
jgi:hypothetical protein